MNILKKLLSIDLFVLAVNLPFVTTDAQGSGDFTAPTRPYWQYSAKIICGNLPNDDELVKGEYSTTINMKNTSSYQQLQFRLQAVVNSQISPYQAETLVANDAMSVNCTDIQALFTQGGAPQLPFDGFLVIQVLGSLVPASPDPMDIVASYSARADGWLGVTTMNVVQIPVKYFP